ncbi:hypothetical protein BDN67DRAFT_1022945 [Paxillus ammoniavirescens]|nr:hypothetical protein BDN67DRAFT_1022945 [Paxillus ammoniavirescens]
MSSSRLSLFIVIVIFILYFLLFFCLLSSPRLLSSPHFHTILCHTIPCPVYYLKTLLTKTSLLELSTSVAVWVMDHLLLHSQCLHYYWTACFVLGFHTIKHHTRHLDQRLSAHLTTIFLSNIFQSASHPWATSCLIAL